MVDNIVRRPAAMKAGGFTATSSLYDAVNQGRFPKPIKIGPRAVGWLESELKAWQAQRIAERDHKAGKAA